MPAVIVKVAPLDGANLLDVARALPYGKALGISPSEKLHVLLEHDSQEELERLVRNLPAAYVLSSNLDVRVE